MRTSSWKSFPTPPPPFCFFASRSMLPVTRLKPDHPSPELTQPTPNPARKLFLVGLGQLLAGSEIWTC